MCRPPKAVNLHHLLLQREEQRKPLRVVLIGAGKFGSMFLSQVRTTRGLHLIAVADLAPERARAALVTTGWSPEQFDARSFADAASKGTTFVTDDAHAAIAAAETEIVIDATGHPAAGIGHVLACCSSGKHVVMVNVEADALAGPLLARRAADAGIVYSLAYGDQPALICEMVDWARAAGFDVVAAGKGTKYLPAYHASTPETVWRYYGITPADARVGGLNAQMFNSFLDGTKSAIEMAAVANATGLRPAPDGLAFPPCGVDDLPRIGVVMTLRPGLERLEWYGRGPWEAYSDRLASTTVGRFRSTVAEQYVPYVRPQEHGHHPDARWVRLVDARGRGLEIRGVPSIGFAASHFSAGDLTAANHVNELEPRPEVVLSLDHAQRGLGTASCGPDAAERYRLRERRYSFAYSVRRI